MFDGIGYQASDQVQRSFNVPTAPVSLDCTYSAEGGTDRIAKKTDGTGYAPRPAQGNLHRTPATPRPAATGVPSWYLAVSKNPTSTYDSRPIRRFSFFRVRPSEDGPSDDPRPFDVFSVASSHMKRFGYTQDLFERPEFPSVTR